MKERLFPMLALGTIFTVTSIILLTNKNNTGNYGLYTFFVGVGLLVSTGMAYWKIKKKTKL
ncbi:hypothetical protein [uncultured Kordia sp.]|uniref:hypothetical protein n=1 Tax=uncultured Kordia sp. TaxID=507699 RepID=UPI0026308195|nr:hypothetical protein [uncultured Kordia sp.]